MKKKHLPLDLESLKVLDSETGFSAFTKPGRTFVIVGLEHGNHIEHISFEPIGVSERFDSTGDVVTVEARDHKAPPWRSFLPKLVGNQTTPVKVYQVHDEFNALSELQSLFTPPNVAEVG